MLSYFESREAILYDTQGKVSKEISKGCPQGSILGPFIWNIVFNGSMSTSVDEIAFADDKVILIHGKSRKELEDKSQIAIDFMSNWCKLNKMELSASKTVLLQLKGKFDNQRPPKVLINGRSIKMVKTTRYLGVDIDERLGVSTHIARVSSSAKKSFHTMARLSKERWGLSQKTLTILYKAVVESTLSYACAGWFDRTNCHHVRSLQSAQRNTLLRIAKAYRTVSTDAVNIIAKILPIDLLLKERVLRYKARKGMEIVHGSFHLQAGSYNNKMAIKKSLRQNSIAIWQCRWNNSNKGRITYEFVPNIQDHLSIRRALSKSVCQVITGHGKFKTYLKRFKLSDCIICECKIAAQTVEHLIFECPLLQQVRQGLIEFVTMSGRSWPIDNSEFLQEKYLAKFSNFCDEIVAACAVWNN